MNYLSEFIINKRKDVLIYGAGGVAKDLIILLNSVLPDLYIKIAVSNLEGNPKNINGISVNSIDYYKNDSHEYQVIIATMPETASIILSDLEKTGFEDVITVDEIINIMYQEIWKEPVIKNKLVLAHGGGAGYGDNGKYICEAISECSKDIDLVWGVSDINKEFPKYIRKVQYGTYDYYKELGTSFIWIDDQHKNYFSRKRSGQFYIQTWHGIGPIKRIEYDADSLPSSYLRTCDLNSEMEDLFISASSFNSEQCRRAFHYYGDILECGYPRNDILFDNSFDVDKLKSKLGINNKRIVLYAPTFREGNKPIRPDFNNLISALEYRFKEDFVVLIRLHPVDKSKDQIVFDDRIINVTNYDDVQELLRISDILVTDYSSIMWDFSLQKKPVFLFHPDDKKYQEERGNYLKFSDMPYIEAESNEDLREMIKNFDEGQYIKALNVFFAKYKSFDMGDASKKIAELIISKIVTED